MASKNNGKSTNNKLSKVKIPSTTKPKKSFKLQSVAIKGTKAIAGGNGRNGHRISKHKDAMTAVRAGDGYQPAIQPKNKGGRPSKYKPEYCDMLIDHMARGNPVQTFAAIAHITVDGLNKWFQMHPDFLHAKNIGKPYQLAWWLELGKALTVDDPTYQLELLGVKPFLKKHTIRSVRGDDDITEEVHEYHVPRGNTGVFCYIVNNMFRDIGWRNPQQIEHSGPGGGSIKMESKSLALVAEVPTEDLRTLNRIMMAASEQDQGQSEEG